mgnify:CR=1 FL=1
MVENLYLIRVQYRDGSTKELFGYGESGQQAMLKIFNEDYYSINSLRVIDSDEVEADELAN